ncbi:hypothetical protein HDU85_000006 [Gaertneriomyces sp. JEL0708]|nr:hypothetical protein HDU85_000006 [Gaertneriomyces sp. JEL0708]
MGQELYNLTEKEEVKKPDDFEFFMVPSLPQEIIDIIFWYLDDGQITMDARVATPYLAKLQLSENVYDGFGFKSLIENYYFVVYVLYYKYHFNMMMDDEDVLHLLTCVRVRKKLLDFCLELGLLDYERLYRLCCRNFLPFAEVFLDRFEIVRAIPSQLEDLLATAPSHFCSIILNRVTDINAEDIRAVIERGLIRRQYPLGTVKMLTRRGFRFSKAVVRHLLDYDHLASVEHLARNFKVDTLVEEGDSAAHRIIAALVQRPQLVDQSEPFWWWTYLWFFTTTQSLDRVERVDDFFLLVHAKDARNVYRVLHYSFKKLWGEHGGPKTPDACLGYELGLDLYWHCIRICYLALDQHFFSGEMFLTPAMQEDLDRYIMDYGGTDHSRYDAVFIEALSSHLTSFGISYQTYAASLVSDAFMPVQENTWCLRGDPPYDEEYVQRSLCERTDLPQSWRDVRF